MKKLRDSLQELKNEIKNTAVTDGVSKAKLSDLTEKIDKVLDAGGSELGEHHRVLNRSLKDAMLHFEVKYPKLTSYINSISSALADLGI